MSPPSPRINTYMNVAKIPILDVYSKIFIIIELILGTNRLLILGIKKKVYVLLLLTYSLSIHIVLLYFVVHKYNEYIFQLIVVADFIQYLMCNVLAFIFQEKFLNFYIELNKFDGDIGFIVRKAGNRKSIQNYFQIFVTIGLSFTFYGISNNFERNNIPMLILLPMKFLHCFELHYYGHMFILIIPRIKLIINYIRFSYPNEKNCEHEETSGRDEKLNNFKKQIKKYSKIDMKSLINYYNRIIIIFDYLYESIKWQVLILFYMK
ncbi:uncharacterized protein LOC135193754 [Vanessa tameamea]|uniref:Uncharacterized protein LOC135193754 n=1 Tax=Vanessa tameamea TaxID=334116 RepID=A0ABM4AQS1_VANTA